MSSTTFENLVCARFRCSAAQYPEMVLRHCTFVLARPLACLLWHVRRGYFKPELKLLEEVRTATSYQEVARELNDFLYRHPRRYMGLGHRWLRIRLSGARLLRLARRLYAEASESPRAVAHAVPA